MKRILAMPDIFIDHFLYAGEIDNFLRDLKSTLNSGARFGRKQEIRLGGNAYNFAMASAMLGSRVVLASRTSQIALDMARRSSADLPLSLKYVSSDYEPSLTVAIEGDYRGKHANLNINSPGGLLNFDFSSLPSTLLSQRFDAVCVFNLNNNMCGADLAISAFSHFRSLRLLDLPDPSSAYPSIRKLRRAIALADIVTGNEREIIAAARRLSLTDSQALADCGKALATIVSTVAVHTGQKCYEFNPEDYVAVPVRRKRIRSSTGAGDAWTAGYLHGLMNRLDASARLELANRTALSYIELHA